MARPLDPVSLHLFVAVCEEGSIARAADREALVASALSKRIGALEAEVGVPLLVRRRRGIEPTAAGEALLARARELLSALERMRSELGAFGQGVQGSVRVLASPSVLAERLPEDIGRFLDQYPRLTVSLDEKTSPDIVRSLREGTADLGVLWDFADTSGLHVLPYRNDHLCVAMSPQHALARRASLTYAETLDQVSVGVAPGGLMDQLLRRQAALLGRIPSHRIQVSSIDAACRIVAAGLGLAVLPREVAVPHAGAGRLALVALKEPWAKRRFVVLTRPAPLQSASARLLAQFLHGAAADRASEHAGR
ncbi:MAG: LysR family transcriptional regulator [Burkholderiales bacterium]|nr:LysR family transcriptional regulator [Burkholderiales bacterium]